MGRTGLRNTRVGGDDAVELAYALAAEYRNRRMATTLTFERLDLTNIGCFTLPTNRTSQHVMEKAGFADERVLVHARLPPVLYRITAAG